MKPGPDALSLTLARRDIPRDTFGYVGQNYCQDCRGFDEELRYRRTHRQTWEQPEEGIEVCPYCGSEEAGENQQDHYMTARQRYSTRITRRTNP